MQKSDLNKQKLVYGLDIGTRNIVGTVGYLEKDRFIVVAQRMKEHETRAMIDGQIHDIGAVGETIREVTQELEEELHEKLSSVCIAAAGRVLRTVTTHVDIDFEGEKIVTKEDIFALDSYGVEKAYEQFQESNDLDMKFYCVGYTVMRYFMNDYPMSNLENHKAKTIAADLIATFLPDDVVDGLYKAVEIAGLEVANLTLEPIAAMEVAIPQMYRMLNIALIDVGAGTSDISITKEGSIVAYGMLPIAGDCLTEDIAMYCLVDFATAETIKKGIETSEEVEYKDIMGLPQKITREAVLEVVSGHLSSMAQQAADKIMELNGNKPVSAVFIVGGGGKIEGYSKMVADRLGIAPERCAIRGEEVMQKIDFMQKNIVKDSLLVTPIGICLNYYEQSNNFVFVTFNGERIKLYDNNKLAIVDAAMGAEFPNEDLFPKRGENLTFLFNGKQKVIRGQRGESAQITLNGKPADIHTSIRANDVIVVENSTAGGAATMELSKLSEYQETLRIIVNGTSFTLPKFASVNGNLQSGYYEIQENDEIEMLGYYTVEQVITVMDVQLEENMQIMVNHQEANYQTKVYDNFTLDWELKKVVKKEEVPADNPETEAEREGVNNQQAQITEAENSAFGNIIDGASNMSSASSVTKTETVQLEPSEAVQQKPASSTGNSKLNSILEKARKSAQEIADAPVTQEVEEEFKKAKAYAAAERISAFATAFNQTGQMPPAAAQMPKLNLGTGASKPTAESVQALFKKNSAQTVSIEQPKSVEPAKAIESTAAASASSNTVTENETVAEPAKPLTDSDGSITVVVNGDDIHLTGKSEYVFVDVFDHINFDFSRPQGKAVETLLNGRKAQYMENLHTGDVLEIFWKD